LPIKRSLWDRADIFGVSQGVPSAYGEHWGRWGPQGFDGDWNFQFAALLKYVINVKSPDGSLKNINTLFAEDVNFVIRSTGNVFPVETVKFRVETAMMAVEWCRLLAIPGLCRVTALVSDGVFLPFDKSKFLPSLLPGISQRELHKLSLGLGAFAALGASALPEANIVTALGGGLVGLVAPYVGNAALRIWNKAQIMTKFRNKVVTVEVYNDEFVRMTKPYSIDEHQEFATGQTLNEGADSPIWMSKAEVIAERKKLGRPIPAHFYAPIDIEGLNEHRVNLRGGNLSAANTEAMDKARAAAEAAFNAHTRNLTNAAAARAGSAAGAIAAPSNANTGSKNSDPSCGAVFDDSGAGADDEQTDAEIEQARRDYDDRTGPE
jgi:hypothetical protein